MKKVILIFTLTLIWMMSWGQTLKLMNYYLLEPDGLILSQQEYIYDDNYNLLRIDHKFANQVFSYHYSNDTIVMETYEYAPGDTAYTIYTYYPDSIVLYDPNNVNIKFLYLLDGLGHITYYDYFNATFIWEGENCIEKTDDGIPYTATFHPLNNPFYEENKYFRYWLKGSVNFSNYTIGNGITYNNVVTDTIENYPLNVERYKNGVLEYKYQFDYQIIEDVPEVQPGGDEVFSIDYYDILGRKIPKPDKGFYIERRTTDKGTESKKYFIK